MLKVLIVEDEPDLAEIYIIEFKACGAEVFQTDKAEVAFELAKEKQPDIIFLDLLLTKTELSSRQNSRSGYVLLDRLKADIKTKDIKVVICSNLDTQEDKDKAKKLGACCYVVKSEVVPSDLVYLAKKLIQ